MPYVISTLMLNIGLKVLSCIIVKKLCCTRVVFSFRLKLMFKDMKKKISKNRVDEVASLLRQTLKLVPRFS